MISIILEEQGYSVISLADTAGARKKLHDKEIIMAMLDKNLKGENGKLFCKYIKSHKDLKHIQVILVSADMEIQRIKEECGADNYIKKPFDLGYFYKIVDSYAQRTD